MTHITVGGFVAPGWEPVKAAFEKNFELGEELGASAAVYHRGAAFAMRGELGPVRGDLLVVVDQPALHAHRDRDGDNAFRGAEHQLQRGIVVRPIAGEVERSTPDVDHLDAPVVYGSRCAKLFAELEVLLECGFDRFPTGCDESADGDVRHSGDGIGVQASSTIARSVSI